jgi:hypothetical protein
MGVLVGSTEGECDLGISALAYPGGSSWCKWDLHVHTPDSLVQEYGGSKKEVWERFLRDLESLPPEFKVLGINDYIFLDGYKKMLKEKKRGRLKNIELHTRRKIRR